MLHAKYVEIGPPVPEKNIFEGFLPVWAWPPSWSCELNLLYIHWLPDPIDASHKIWL